MDKNLDYLEQLTKYLIRNLRKGYTKESLRWALIGQGHSKLEVEKAFRKVEEEMTRKAPILKTKPKITREFVETKTDTPTQPERKKSFLDKWFG